MDLVTLKKKKDQITKSYIFQRAYKMHRVFFAFYRCICITKREYCPKTDCYFPYLFQNSSKHSLWFYLCFGIAHFPHPRNVWFRLSFVRLWSWPHGRLTQTGQHCHHCCGLWTWWLATTCWQNCFTLSYLGFFISKIKITIICIAQISYEWKHHNALFYYVSGWCLVQNKNGRNAKPFFFLLIPRPSVCCCLPGNKFSFILCHWEFLPLIELPLAILNR